MDSRISSVDQAKVCLLDKSSFILQGGAGSGKTESLKELITYLHSVNPKAKLVCITHTNLAVDEIKSRVGEEILVSTIHSFVEDIIKDYKVNIKEVIAELFKLPILESMQIIDIENEKEHKKIEHEKYKKLCKKYLREEYKLSKQEPFNYVDKREYDKNPESYNSQLNQAILGYNDIIQSSVKERNYYYIKYNKTKFNNFKELSYGHDGLIDIFIHLSKKYTLLKKIISDKYDYILIDEFQDTRSDVIDCFVDIVASNQNFCIGLFGDSMQSIYKEGVGSIDKHINSGLIKLILKEDNYRCSYQVLDLINNLRLDNTKQSVALKRQENGLFESTSNRQGKVRFLYKVVPGKPTTFSSQEDKDNYLNQLKNLIDLAEGEFEHTKILLLTNKGIASEVGFGELYKVFSNRYTEVGDHIERTLEIIMAYELAELCIQYIDHNFNYVITSLKSNGYLLKSVNDKVFISNVIADFINGQDSIINTVNKAIELKFLKISESYCNYIERANKFIKDCELNEKFCAFELNYNNGINTFARMKKDGISITEEEFNELQSIKKKKDFYTNLFSDDLKFKDVLNYVSYINEKFKYITMHKTKGSSIDSVLLVLDEYFWNEYNFKTIYDGTPSDDVHRIRAQRLFYVACSRARSNLTCVKLIEESEEVAFKRTFPFAQKIN